MQNETLEQATWSHPRLFFIDHWRAALVVLVVLHHISLVYGASIQGYYYVEPPFGSPRAFAALLAFAMVNQGWFMGAFFLIAGYFTPGSFDRRGLRSFTGDKLLRLGIPLLVFFFVLNPVSFTGYYLMPAQLTGIADGFTWARFWKAYPGFIGLGPMWFVAMLLVFYAGYAAWRLVARNRFTLTEGQGQAPGYLSAAAFMLGLAGTSYLWRMAVPLGREFAQFPTLSYLPQYVSFFVIGMLAYRKGWFYSIPDAMGWVGFVAAGAVSILLFPLAFSGEFFSLAVPGALENLAEPGHWQTAVYALWDSIFAVGMCLGLLVFFRRFFQGQGRLGRFLSQQSYTVYLIHMPLVVFLTYAMRGIEMGVMLKLGVASVVIVPACFAAAALIRMVPGAERVL